MIAENNWQIQAESLLRPKHQTITEILPKPPSKPTLTGSLADKTNNIIFPLTEGAYLAKRCQNAT
jgi:hypothetical protein